jgi:ABC-type microcin C transport system duplicated ATPase subunit YejF
VTDVAATGAPLVEIRHLVKHFPITGGILQRTVAQVQAVDDVSFTIRRGETLGLVGESGCGKTTVGRLLLRLIEPTAGEIVFDGQDLANLRGSALKPYRRRMQIIFQDPYASLDPRTPIGDSIGEGLRIHAIGRPAERREKVRRIMDLVGLAPYHARRYPHEFSGGQRQRIALARAVVLEPNFVVLDEPTSALDMLIQAQMVDLLRDLQKRRELTYMFISHDLRVVSALSSRLVVMCEGKVVETGPAAEIFKAPKNPYTRALFAAAFNLEAAPEGVVAQ